MLGINPLLCHTLFVQIEIELLIIIFPPGKLRLDKYLLYATVRKQYFLQLLSPCIEFIVIVTIHFDAIGTRVLTDVITEPLVLQTVHIPATAAQLGNLTYQTGFQRIWETAVLILLLEIDLNISPACIVDRSMKLLDFLKTAEISLHPLHQGIHLFQCAPVRQVGIGRKHHFFITTKITTLIHFLHKQTKAATQSFIYYGFHFLLIGGRSQCLVIPFCPLAFSFHFFGKQEDGQAKAQYQHNAHRHPPTQQEANE